MDYPTPSITLVPSPSATLVRRCIFALCSASLRPRPPEKEDMLCPLQDALLGEGDPQLCLGAACSSLVVCSLDDDDVLSCVGCEYSDSTSSNWSSTFFEVGCGRFCADFRTASAFFFGGSQMRGRSDMCPIFDDGDEDWALISMRLQSVRRMPCLQWQSRVHALS